MSRYFSIIKLKEYIKKIKNIKEAKVTHLEFKRNLKYLIKTVKDESKPTSQNVLKFILPKKVAECGKQLYQVQHILENKDKLPNIQYLDLKNTKDGKKLYKIFQKKKNNFQLFNGKAFALGATGLTLVEDKIVDPVPEPPPIPEEDVLNQLNELGETTFASLGLGGWTPVGIVQNCFEYLHVTLGVEWWAAVALGTLVIRLTLFPLVIISQRNAAKMNNSLPQMQAIQLKMTEARQMGNQIDAARYSQELMIFMKEKQLNPFKNMIVPLAQMPIFVSFFMALRQMCNVPVDSLRTGGLWWFTDLTLPDQYFLMPIITSATLYATIELGTDSAKLSSQNMQLMKYVLRGLPIVILPFTVNFPGAILCYWVSSNFISLAQVGFLKIPSVRDYFKIEPLQHFNPESLPMKPKGFREGIKDSWTNLKITKELEERSRLDEIQFQRAGKGPIMKTYKYDPTAQASPTKSTPMNAKNR